MTTTTVEADPGLVLAPAILVRFQPDDITLFPKSARPTVNDLPQTSVQSTNTESPETTTTASSPGSTIVLGASDPADTSPSGQSPSAGAKAGIAIGVLLLCALGLLIGWWFFRRYRARGLGDKAIRYRDEDQRGEPTGNNVMKGSYRAPTPLPVLGMGNSNRATPSPIGIVAQYEKSEKDHEDYNNSFHTQTELAREVESSSGFYRPPSQHGFRHELDDTSTLSPTSVSRTISPVSSTKPFASAGVVPSSSSLRSTSPVTVRSSILTGSGVTRTSTMRTGMTATSSRVDGSGREFVGVAVAAQRLQPVTVEMGTFGTARRVSRFRSVEEELDWLEREGARINKRKTLMLDDSHHLNIEEQKVRDRIKALQSSGGFRV